MRCRHCSTFLTELTRRSGSDTCGAAACRRRAAQLQLSQRRALLTAQALQNVQTVQAQQPAVQPQPPQVVWLESTQRNLVPVTQADRDDLRAQIEAALQAGTVFDFPAAALAHAVPAQSGRLCAQCGGGCCTYGAARHGFVDSVVLQRWQSSHPGSSVADAIQAYVDMLPAAHVQYSCLFLTAQGCATPRELRADTCNHYACQALQELRLMLNPGTQHAVVALTLDHGRLERAALITAEATHALTGLAGSADACEGSASNPV